MNWLYELAQGFARLFGGGEIVLMLIFLLTAALWALIIERYWYFLFVHPDVLENALTVWRRRAGGPTDLLRRARRRLLSELEERMTRSVSLIRSLLGVIFLLGLLGSLGGMIKVLDALPVMGDAGTHTLAGAILAAGVPVITALAAVFTGILFSQELAQRVQRETRLLRDQLRRQ